MATLKEQELVLHFMAMSYFFNNPNLLNPGEPHHEMTKKRIHQQQSAPVNNKKMKIAQFINSLKIVDNAVALPNPSRQCIDTVSKKTLSSLVLKKSNPTIVMAAINPHDDCYSFQRGLWNKPFKAVMASDFYKYVVLPVIQSKFDRFAASEKLEKFKYFLNAGYRNTDFIQLNVEKDKTDHHARCMFCYRMCSTVVLCGTHSRSAPIRKGTFKHVSEPVFCVGKQCCMKDVLDIIEIYHYIWSMSKPLKGYVPQGFAMMPTPTAIFYGSPNQEDMLCAYNTFKRLLRGDDIKIENQFDRILID